jgi:hypothetical protein
MAEPGIFEILYSTRAMRRLKPGECSTGNAPGRALRIKTMFIHHVTNERLRASMTWTPLPI